MLLAKGLISLVLWCVVKSELILQPNETDMCSNYSCLAASPACSCDPLCSVYGDCCLDAKNVSVIAKHPMKCFSVSDEFVYMISACDDGNPTDGETRQKCDVHNPIHINPNPYDSVPVTNVDTQITYRNVHCAKCNGDTNVVPWNMNITLHEISDNFVSFPTESQDAFDNAAETFLADNLAYFKEKTSWGVQLWINGSHEFFPADITATAPAEVTPRRCEPGLTESCPPDWTDSRIASLCELFRDTVSDSLLNYKNKFCALCDGLTREDVKCSGQPYIPVSGPQASLKTVLEFNTALAMNSCESEGKHHDVFKNCKGTFKNDHKDVEIV